MLHIGWAYLPAQPGITIYYRRIFWCVSKSQLQILIALVLRVYLKMPQSWAIVLHSGWENVFLALNYTIVDNFESIFRKCWRNINDKLYFIPYQDWWLNFQKKSFKNGQDSSKGDHIYNLAENDIAKMEGCRA